MKGFKFDVPRAIEFMEHGTAVNRMSNELSMYAVVCLNEDHASSHGGAISSVVDGRFSEGSIRRAIDAAIAEAIDANETDPPGKTCKYVPVCIGLDPRFLDGLARQLYNEPAPGDRPLLFNAPPSEEEASDESE